MTTAASAILLAAGQHVLVPYEFPQTFTHGSRLPAELALTSLQFPQSINHDWTSVLNASMNKLQ